MLICCVRLYNQEERTNNKAKMSLSKKNTPLMQLLVVVLFLLWLSPHSHSLRHSPAVNLRRFIGCAVREFTFLARKPGCGGLHITTDACWGRCETWEKPVLDPPFIESYQRVCTYNETRLVTVKLPNCLPKVDPMYTYPVALRCDCGVCQTSTTECITSV